MKEKINFQENKSAHQSSGGLLSGVIYRYTLKTPGIDCGKVYIGHTMHEHQRKRQWNNLHNSRYGGDKIQNARAKYGVKDWNYDVLEALTAATEEDLRAKLRQRETYWITKEFADTNGFNSCKGSGMQGKHHTAHSKQLISQNHRSYQTANAKTKISSSMKGRVVSQATKSKISAGNKGKKRTPAQNQAQSKRLKGIEPKAASAGLQAYIQKNGHGPTLGIKQSVQARANMKKAQQSRGTITYAIFPDAHEEQFPTMLDAAKATGHMVGSVANAIKSGGKTKKGFKFHV